MTSSSRKVNAAIKGSFRAAIFFGAIAGGLAVAQSGNQDSTAPPNSSASAPVAPTPAQNAGSAPVQTADQGGTIQGVVRSGNSALPGVTVTATNTLTGEKETAWTDLDGNFTVNVASNGRYVLRSQMSAFAPATQEALINAANRQTRVTLEPILASRVQQEKPGAGQGMSVQSIVSAVRGFQSLALVQQSETGGDSGSVVPSGVSVPGISTSTATESIAVSGGNSTPNFSNMSSEEMSQRFQEQREQRGFGGGFGGGPAGGGGPRGGGGGPPGGGGMFFGKGGRLDLNRPHGSVYYTGGSDALSAAPYALRGSQTKPGYLQNRYGFNLGGPLNIPKIYKGGTKTFFFANFNGNHNTNPYNNFATVPTDLERSGNFSQSTISSLVNGQQNRQPVQLFQHCPLGSPPPCQQVDPASITSQAQGLLAYIPRPNVSGATTQNFHFVESVASSSNDLNVRLIHSLAGSLPTPPGMGRGGGGFKPPNNTLTFGFHYHDSHSTITNPFPSESGNTDVKSFDIPVGYIRNFGKVTNIATVEFNRNRSQTLNLYANQRDITGQLGITGVSTNPFDFGLPNISLSHFTSLNDVTPTLRRDQTYSFSDFMIYTRGKHSLHWGGDFRRIQVNSKSSNNPRGTFVFTGCNTAEIVSSSDACSGVVSGTGYDFADFLLGLPQQTSVQYGLRSEGQNNYHFRGNSWDGFINDEWRFRGSLTFNLGLRYEYISPYSEVNDRIVNLDLNSSFRAADPVLPNQTGAFSGKFPRTLVRPDRNNFAPRLGLAWKASTKMVVRAGYGINYNTTAYSEIIQQLAYQPPFSFTQTNVQASAAAPLNLQHGFSATTTGITNSYAVNPNYRVGYVQIWNVDVQQEILPTLLLNFDYVGTKGTRLDITDAPNRTLTGVNRIPDAQSFNFEDSLGDSTAEVGSVRLRKRLQAGISLGGSYTWSKAIDNASSIGGGSTVVAQDAFNLQAERGLSSFDQRHRFSGNFLWELPAGHERRWLATNGVGRDILGDWQLSGDWTVASGTPFTPRVLGDPSDVNRGTNGTLRANFVPGESVSISNATIRRWFNTAAFTEPLMNTYGNARRNSVPGPRDVVFNMAFTKVFPLKENRVFEVRTQASNLFNHPHFNGLDTVVNSPTFGRVTSVDSMRTIQFTARLRF